MADKGVISNIEGRVRQLMDDHRNREKARARVNRLMREVDKCIALAEQPFDASSAPETRTAE